MTDSKELPTPLERENAALREALRPFLRRDVIKYGARARGVVGEYDAHVRHAQQLLGEPVLGIRAEDARA